MQRPSPLPVDTVLPELRDVLRSRGTAVLEAAPAAGKTTRVPLALLEAGIPAEGRTVMLEPRRLAASRAARFMAAALGEDVGQTVGYRIRGDTRVSASTRIEVVTEGVLTRMLQDDPALPGVGLVIFDEFHERSIHADLGLAFVLDSREHLRPDLALLVMSATLDGAAVARLLGNAPAIGAGGRVFPVETRYRTFPVEGPIEAATADTIRRALDLHEGDLLVFLPGRREIHRTRRLLESARLPGEVDLHELFSDAAREEQDAALRAAPAGRRKVILSTSIAETSVTIDGVRVVIDAGLARVPVFDPRRGMSGLATVPVSRATADQRRGRAGRQAPGVCWRLWTEAEHQRLPPFPTPEILSTDLTPAALDLARWGSPDGGSLRFLDPPPAAHLARARSLLQSLGALDAAGTLTPHGREMAGLPVHPRLAHMLIRSRREGRQAEAAELAALLGEREVLSRPSPADIDIGSRLEALAGGQGADPGVRGRIRTEAVRLGGGDRERTPRTARSTGYLLSFAFPERIARRRGEGTNRFLTTGGTGVVVPEAAPLAREEFLVIAELATAGVEARALLAAPVTREELLAGHGAAVREEEETVWDEPSGAVIMRQVTRLGAVTLLSREVPPVGEAVRELLLGAVVRSGLASLPWSQAAVAFRARCRWIGRRELPEAGWPDLSDGALLSSLAEWLGPFLGGMSRRAHLERLDIHAALRARCSPLQLRELERLAPESVLVPTGSRIRLDYEADPGPVLAVRLQEMFGATATPLVGGGRVPVVLHLLSPAGRPLAVTQDLVSFWKNAYPQVRKEMRGRYPRHHWPEDPLAAAPTRRTKRRT
jgi:ATP-dependent helicase HrpB